MRRATLVIGSLGLVASLFGLVACSHAQHAASGLSGTAGGGSSIGGAPIGALGSAAGGASNGSANAAANRTSAGIPTAATVPKPAGPDSVDLGGPSLIRTADMTVSATDVGAQADRARQIVTVVGGSVDGDDRTSGTDAVATLTLRVPPSSLEDVLTRLSALGKEMTRTLSTQDVTTTVADIDSRVQSAAQAIDQLRSLYAKAQTVADLIAIETQLTQREADLESLQAQQRALAGQVAMATVTLHLVTPAQHNVIQHKSSGGFVGGLRRGWHAFTAAATGLFTGIAAVLPFAVLGALGFLGWLSARRRWRRSPDLGPTPSPAAAP